jgi:ABC-2 type transport system ATP-binding protein
MKQKTALAGALLHDPKLLLLDEPFSGLDAAVARQVKELLVEKTKEGATIVLTTHVMEIAERLAERVGIFHRGRLLADGSLSDLRAQAGQTDGSLEDIFIQLVDDASVGSPA